ncbi:TPA: hypothetical protein SLO06_002457 [Proteus mirabilis]|nr:hypothetical protein [Proteus mirabilis]HEJ9518106.1 hypothetical protein [Proteus mirabilis]
MSSDKKFFKFLGNLPNGQELQDIYKKYKNSNESNSFNINGALRSAYNIDSDLKNEIDKLNSIFRAKNKSPLTLYRMTSSTEFTPSGAEVALNLPFRYPPFLSTTRNVSVLRKFIPPNGTPTILIIDCPKDTKVALMEGSNNDQTEEEVLLQSYTEYKITASQIIEDSNVLQNYLGKDSKLNFCYELKMQITNNSSLNSSEKEQEFFSF